MSDADPSIVGMQAEALLATLRTDLERRRGVEQQAALLRARSIVGAAHREARVKFAEAREAERQRSEQVLRRAQAAAETRLRQRAHALARTAVARAWEQLPDALVQRWCDAASRQDWIRHTVRLAQARLLGRGWQVEHAPGMTAADRERCFGTVAGGGGLTVAFAEQPTLRAGLCIRADGAVLDATVAGLLAERERVTARLLALLDEAPPP